MARQRYVTGNGATKNVGATHASPIPYPTPKDTGLDWLIEEPQDSHRRSIRLPTYDYAQTGAYFVTVCTRNGACIFGTIQKGKMRLNEIGRMANQTWEQSPTHFPQVKLDAWVVMPNHIHGIIVIFKSPPAGMNQTVHTQWATHASPLRNNRPTGPSKSSIGAIVGSFKSAVTKQVNAMRDTSGPSIWQRNYYEHIIRSEPSMDRIRQYIADNPANWSIDPENPH